MISGKCKILFFLDIVVLINIDKRYFRSVVFSATWSMFPCQQPKIGLKYEKIIKYVEIPMHINIKKLSLRKLISLIVVFFGN